MAKISKEQWEVIERKHLVDGESINSLAKKYKVNESSIRRKLYTKKAEADLASNSLKDLANEKFRIENERRRNAEQIAELPTCKQMIVDDIFAKLFSISRHVTDGAEYGAKTFSTLSKIANQHAEKLDENNPCEERLATIAKLTRVGNDSVATAMTLINNRKDRVQQLEDKESAEEDDFSEIKLVALEK